MDIFTMKLKQVMADKNINQNKLAVLSGVSRPYISQILSGKHIPRVDIVCRLCIGLQCSIGELIEIN